MKQFNENQRVSDAKGNDEAVNLAKKDESVGGLQ